jgi:hypothetical protein
VNDLFVSEDSGATWADPVANTDAAGQQWIAVASNSNGAHLVAVSTDPGGGGASPCCLGDVWTN